MTVPAVAAAPPAAGRRSAVSVFADLRIDSDGERAHLVGDGTALVLHTDSPLRLWSTINRAALPSGVGRVNGPRALGRAADLLARAGVSVDVMGPRGSVVRLGDGADSAFGRLTTGSVAVQFGSIPVLASTLSAQVPVRRYSLVATLVVLAGAVITARHRRR
jgi:hypothetical protein